MQWAHVVNRKIVYTACVMYSCKKYVSMMDGGFLSKEEKYVQK